MYVQPMGDCVGVLSDGWRKGSLPCEPVFCLLENTVTVPERGVRAERSRVFQCLSTCVGGMVMVEFHSGIRNVYQRCDYCYPICA